MVDEKETQFKWTLHKVLVVAVLLLTLFPLVGYAWLYYYPSETAEVQLIGLLCMGAGIEMVRRYQNGIRFKAGLMVVIVGVLFIEGVVVIALTR